MVEAARRDVIASRVCYIDLRCRRSWVDELDAIGGLPTCNLQSGRLEGAEAISGGRLVEEYLGHRVACTQYPVACIHLAALRIPYPNDPSFRGAAEARRRGS
jgi:aldehyde:ferredoxin oxidoreductase